MCANKSGCECEKKPASTEKSISSPINVGDFAKAAPQNLKEPWDFNGLDKLICTEIRNDGRQIKLRLCPKQSPIISGGGLSHTEYIIESIDFHWYSEHTINDQRYPLEAHILMYCSEFSDINEALDKQGAAAFSVLYEYSNNSSSGICKLIPFVTQISKSVNKPIPYCVITLNEFLPEDKNNFYRYKGSSSDPPFKLGLEWTVFKEKLPITRLDLGNFTNIHDEQGSLIVANFRELQPTSPGAEIFYFSSDGKNCVCSSPAK